MSFIHKLLRCTRFSGLLKTFMFYFLFTSKFLVPELMHIKKLLLAGTRCGHKKIASRISRTIKGLIWYLIQERKQLMKSHTCKDRDTGGTC